MSSKRWLVASLAILITVVSSPSWALSELFQEDFTSSNAGWAIFNSTAFLTHVASGGPDGGAYATGPRPFIGLTAGNATVILRARHEDPFNASGDAFKFNWIDQDVVEVSAFVRHNMPEAQDFFLRVAGQVGFPGAVFGATAPVPSGTWTELKFDILPTSLQLLSTEGETWGNVFSNVGHVQFGVFVPAGHGTDTTSYAFDIDKVTILTPEPASIVSGLMGLVGLISLPFRRTRYVL